MKSCVYAVLLACVVIIGFAQATQGCWNNAVKEIHEECQKKFKDSNPDNKPKLEFMFDCAMCKLEVITKDNLDFPKLEQAIDSYVIEEKRKELKKAVKECQKNYEEAAENKVKAFFGCYGLKLNDICPIKE